MSNLKEVESAIKILVKSGTNRKKFQYFIVIRNIRHLIKMYLKYEKFRKKFKCTVGYQIIL